VVPFDLAVWLGVAATLIALERLVPMHPGQAMLRSGWKIDLMHLVLSGAVIRLGGTLAVVGLSLLAVSVVPESVRDLVRSQPDLLEFVELLLLSDLCFYIAHRICHAVPFLWRFHAVHHSSEHLDWLASYRVHPVDQILNSAFIALPAVVLGFSPVAVIAYSLLYRLHAPFLHSNIGTDFGPLRHIVASPRFHHWHHANTPEAYDKNFSGQLAIFDKLFGTLNLPDGAPRRYGVDDGVPATYAGQILQPFMAAKSGPSPVQAAQNAAVGR